MPGGAIVKHYQLILSGEEIPNDCQYEIVVSRNRPLLVTEAVCISEAFGTELASDHVRLSKMAYCIEEACMRAVESETEFPIMLHYKHANCVILSHLTAENLAGNAIKDDGAEYCSALFLALKHD